MAVPSTITAPLMAQAQMSVLMTGPRYRQQASRA